MATVVLGWVISLALGDTIDNAVRSITTRVSDTYEYVAGTPGRIADAYRTRTFEVQHSRVRERAEEVRDRYRGS
jgi:hypothetical protein